jgi:hypothetical protein
MSVQLDPRIRSCVEDYSYVKLNVEFKGSHADFVADPQKLVWEWDDIDRRRAFVREYVKNKEGYYREIGSTEMLGYLQKVKLKVRSGQVLGINNNSPLLWAIQSQTFDKDQYYKNVAVVIGIPSTKGQYIPCTDVLNMFYLKEWAKSPMPEKTSQSEKGSLVKPLEMRHRVLSDTNQFMLDSPLMFMKDPLTDHGYLLNTQSKAYKLITTTDFMHDQKLRDSISKQEPKSYTFNNIKQSYVTLPDEATVSRIRNHMLHQKKVSPITDKLRFELCRPGVEIGDKDEYKSLHIHPSYVKSPDNSKGLFETQNTIYADIKVDYMYVMMEEFIK